MRILRNLFWCFIILCVISCVVHETDKLIGKSKIDSILSELLEFVKIGADRREVTKRIMEVKGLTLKDTMIEGFIEPAEFPGIVVYIRDTLPLLLYVWYEGWEPEPDDNKIIHIEVLLPNFVYHDIRIGDTIHYRGEIKEASYGAIKIDTFVVRVKQIGNVNVSETTHVVAHVGSWKIAAGEVYYESWKDYYVYVLAKDDQHGKKIWARYILDKIGNNKFVVRAILLDSRIL